MNDDLLDNLSTPRQVEAALDEGRTDDALWLVIADIADSAAMAAEQVVKDCGLSAIVADAIKNEVRKTTLDYAVNHYG